MAQYKVPQDVEADDKLLGPFSFRQFIYLLIAAALIGLAFLLFKLFPLLCIIPVPPVLFLLALALPLKKDQPMETYLAAVLSFYTKPHKRIWEPGEPESTIIIIAPKKVEESRTKEFNGEEASHRLSFLAEIIDTEGYAIKSNNQLSDEFNAEASKVEDIFESAQSFNVSQTLEDNSAAKHNELVEQMRQAIDTAHNFNTGTATIGKFGSNVGTVTPSITTPPIESTVTVGVQPYAPQQPYAQQPYANQPYPATPMPNTTQPAAPNLPTFETSYYQPSPEDVRIQADMPVPESAIQEGESGAPVESHYLQQFDASTEFANQEITNDESAEPTSEFAQPAPEPIQTPMPAPIATPQAAPAQPSQNMVDLANNSDFSIETIAQQAKRINEEQKPNDGEVYISLH